MTPEKNKRLRDRLAVITDEMHEKWTTIKVIFHDLRSHTFLM